MNKIEMQRRDQVLRAYFLGRDWDDNNELALKRDLVLRSQELLPNYPLLINDEWEVEPNRTQDGKGDLLFTDGAGCYAVVEVKWVDVDTSGSTARSSRTGKRSRVKKQAANYAQALVNCLQTFIQIEGYWFTNECQTPQLIQSLPE
ncbi:MAG: hypothetical protein WBB18_17975 [Nodosilinea sp.]